MFEIRMFLEGSVFVFLFLGIVGLLLALKIYFDKRHNQIVYGCKFFAYRVSLLISPMVFGLGSLLLLLKPGSDRHAKFIEKYFKAISFTLEIKWRQKNDAVLSEDRGCVVVANHQNAFDFLGIYSCWRSIGRCAVILPRKTFLLCPLDRMAEQLNMICTERRKSEETRQRLRAASDAMINEKAKIWFFSKEASQEDGETPGEIVLSRSTFLLAIEAQVPIVPVIYSPYYFLNDKVGFFGSGEVIMQCLEPIETKDLTQEQVDDLMQKTKEAMSKGYAEVCDEVLCRVPVDYPLPSGLKVPERKKRRRNHRAESEE